MKLKEAIQEYEWVLQPSESNKEYYLIGITIFIIILQYIFSGINIILAFILLAINLGFVAILGEYLLESAEKFSVKAKVSAFIIGLVLIPAFSSLPEDVVTVAFNLRDDSLGEVVLGQMLVNNLFEFLIIFGVAGFLACTIGNKCIEVPPKERILVIRNGVLLILSSVLLFILVYFDRTLSFTDGIILFIFYGVFIFVLYFTNKLGIREQTQIVEEIERRENIENINKNKELALMLIFIVLILFVSDLFASNAIFLIQNNSTFEQYSYFYIGIILAIPELILTVVGFLKEKEETTLGMVLGGAIWGCVISMGVQAVVNPVENISSTIIFMFLVVLVVGIISAIIYIRTKWRLKAWECILLIATFFVVIIVILMN